MNEVDRKKKALTAGSSLAINTELNGVTVLELEWFAVLDGGFLPFVCSSFSNKGKKSKPLFTRKTETHGIQKGSTLASGVSDVELMRRARMQSSEKNTRSNNINRREKNEMK